mmetsp:Transcript_17722/g.53950  ORF Transcript_17722/g.53950 Transcript_17722/m.53950 type:complete len:100 (+) Transcript_17722:366-665(+)
MAARDDAPGLPAVYSGSELRSREPLGYEESKMAYQIEGFVETLRGDTGQEVRPILSLFCVSMVFVLSVYLLSMVVTYLIWGASHHHGDANIFADDWRQE